MITVTETVFAEKLNEYLHLASQGESIRILTKDKKEVMLQACTELGKDKKILKTDNVVLDNNISLVCVSYGMADCSNASCRVCKELCPGRWDACQEETKVRSVVMYGVKKKGMQLEDGMLMDEYTRRIERKGQVLRLTYNNFKQDTVYRKL